MTLDRTGTLKSSESRKSMASESLLSVDGLADVEALELSASRFPLPASVEGNP